MHDPKLNFILQKTKYCTHLIVVKVNVLKLLIRNEKFHILLQSRYLLHCLCLLFWPLLMCFLFWQWLRFTFTNEPIKWQFCLQFMWVCMQQLYDSQETQRINITHFVLQPMWSSCTCARTFVAFFMSFLSLSFISLHSFLHFFFLLLLSSWPYWFNGCCRLFWNTFCFHQEKY